MELPEFNVRLDFGFKLEVDIVDQGLDRLIPVLNDRLMEFKGFPMDKFTVNRVRTTIDQLLSAYINMNFIHKLDDNLWMLYIVNLIIEDLGYTIYRGELEYHGGLNAKLPAGHHAMSLLDKDYNLCQQLKNFPGKIIEQLEEIFKNDLFTAAVNKYKEEYIIEIAKI